MLLSQKLLTTIFLHNPTAVAVLDSKDNFYHLNDAFSKLIGYSMNELINQPLCKIWRTDNVEDSSTERYHISETLVMQREVQRKDGTSICVSVAIEHVKEENGAVIKVIFLKDISDEKKDYDITNEVLMKRAEELAQFGSWQTDIVTGITKCSDESCRIYGYDPGSFEPSFDFFLKHVHPDDLAYVKEKTKHTLDSSSTQKLHFRIIDKNGRVKYIRAEHLIERSFNRIPTGLLGFNMDVTESRLKELQIEESYTKYRVLIESSLNAFFLTDDKGFVLDTNHAACSMLGYSKEELLRLSLQQILYQYIEGEVINTEVEAVKKNGERFPIAFTSSVFSTFQGEKRVSLLGVDMTYRKKYETALSELNKDLTKKAEELETSNNELERFAYVASHDLQEPLRMVTSFLELLQKNYQVSLDETANKYINFCMNGTERMKLLIQDLLKYSRVGTSSLEQVPVDLTEVFQDILLFLNTEISQTQARVEASSLPVVIAGKTAMTQLLQNLVSNALKYQAANANPVVTIDVKKRDVDFLFTVSDNGIGIDPKFHEKIFVIFQRLHNRDQYSGTGIGLAICKKIVERYGGKMWVESKKGEGSKFVFTLPHQII